MKTRTYLIFQIVFWLFSTIPALSADKTNTGSLTGRMFTKTGEALAGGKVLLFKELSGPPPSQSRYWRIPDETANIDITGSFKIKLTEGRYYISAMKRTSKDKIGPPLDGDYVYSDSMKNATSKPKLFSVKKGEISDIGLIAEAVPYNSKISSTEDGITAITGTISDATGTPVSGAVVLAFPTANVIGKPLFVSQRTSSNGNYILRVSGSGTYFLKTRTTLKGGHPEEGELIGTHGNGMPAGVTLKSGETLTGIDIRANKYTKLVFPDDEKRAVHSETAE